MVFDILITVPAAVTTCGEEGILFMVTVAVTVPSVAIILDRVVEANAGVHREAERDAVQERDERKEGRNILTARKTFLFLRSTGKSRPNHYEEYKKC